MNKHIQVLPFRRWEEPREAEPAHGLFARLVGLNGHVSVHVFANEIGMNGRYLSPQECLERLSQLPLKELRTLEQNTPLFRGRYVELRNEVLNRNQWSMRARRYCPSCLGESAHHRAWWDIVSLTQCPFHDQALGARPHDNSLRAWYSPSFDVATDGDLLLEFRPRHPYKDTFESYVLGRMGFAVRRADSVLDTASLGDLIEAVETIGKYVLAGPVESTPRVGARGLERARVVAAGYSFLRSTHAQRVAMCAQHSSFATNRERAVGWLYSTLRNMLDNPLQALIAQAAFDAALLGDNYFGFEASDSFSLNDPDYIALGHLAKNLGIYPKTVKRVAESLGYRLERSKGVKYIVVPAGQAQRIEYEVANLMNREEAARFLGVSTTLFRTLASSFDINPLCRFGGRSTKCDRFRRSDLEGLLAAVAVQAPIVAQAPPDVIKLEEYACESPHSLPALLRNIRAGGIKGCLRLPHPPTLAALLIPERMLPRRRSSTWASGTREECLRDWDDVALERRKRSARTGISIADAAAKFGCNRPTIHKLVELGWLPVVAGQTDGGSRIRVDDVKLAKLKQKYASVGEYAQLLGLSRQVMIRRLKSMGVEAIRGTGTGVAALVDRREAERALDLGPVPLELHHLIGQSFNKFLQRRHSLFRPTFRDDAESLHYRTGDRRTSVSIRLNRLDGIVTVGVDSSASYATRRSKVLTQNRSTIEQLWPELNWHIADDERVLRVEESFPFEEIDTPALWPRLFPLIEKRMMRFRDILSPRN